MAWVIILTIAGFLLVAPKIVSADILLNEIMANVPTGENEWIELYNTSSSEVDLSGWSIEERTGSDLTGIKSHPITNLSIPGNGFKIFEFTTSSLNNSGDIITLRDNSSNAKDSYQYSSSTQNKSFGRQPDGGNWNSGLDQTKNSSNGGSPSTPSPSPTQTSSPAATSNTSSFIISNLPPQINSDQSFNVSVNLTLPNNRNTDYNLSGAFKKADGTRYFGLTKINSSWVKYENSNYLNQYKITTDGSGSWTGILEVKPDTSDSDYKGTGDYIFKVSRYTANGSQTWSNESNIKIISTESDKQDSTSTNIPSSETSPFTSPSSVKKAVSTSKSKSYDTLVYHNASVAAATTSATPPTTLSAEVEVKNQRKINPIIWVGLIFIFAGAATLGYIYLKKNAKIHIPFGK